MNMLNFLRHGGGGGVVDQSEYIGSVLWLVVYIIIICGIMAGNLLTILAILLSRQLANSIPNQFIFNLAICDLLVGTTIPYHMCFYMNDNYFVENDKTCIMRFVLITFACSNSINNLFFIATDRYIAVLHPLKYARCMTRKTSFVMIAIGWVTSLTLSTIPIYWNHWQEADECDIDILPPGYFVYLLTPIFIIVWLVMIVEYLRIWKVASIHAKRIRTTNSNFQCFNSSDTKSVQVVMLTLGCFSICWMPYIIVTTYFRISGISSRSSLYYEIGFTMAVANSGMNPIIYAWKNSNFRAAFCNLLTCHSPNDQMNNENIITNHRTTTSPHNGKSIKHNNKEITDGSSVIDMETSCATQVFNMDSLPRRAKT